MEIKAQLKQPYTENEKIDFIVKQNHELGYEIRETETSLEAWGKTDEEKALKEQDKINHLTCTALDLVTFIKQAGLTDAEVLQFLNSNPSLQLQLTLCKDVFCGVVRQLCPLKITETLTLTDEMVIAFFKKKHNIT